MKIAAAYIRVSTEEQTELSPDSQVKLIRDYAKRNDMIVPDKFVFADEGISGRDTVKRLAFNQMIGIAKTKPKPFDCILVWKYSRFARNREDSILYKSMLRKQLGIDVISISENIGDDKMSVLIEALIEAMDEYYSINLAEEVKRGMLEKVSRGGCVAGPALGYDVVNKSYVINPEGAEIVRHIYQEFIGGASIRLIARGLNDRGIETLYGKTFENRTVEYILRNSLYIGKVHWSPSKRVGRAYDHESTITVDGTHKGIIDENTWQQAQTIISRSKKMYPKYSHTKSKLDYMLRGVVRCSTCGATLTMSQGGLQCHEYAKGKCKISHYVSIGIITLLVLEGISMCFETCSFELTRKSETRVQTDYIKTQIGNVYTKLERIKQAYEGGIDSIDEYKANKLRITQELDNLNNKLALSDLSADKKTFAKKYEKTLTLLKGSQIDERQKNELVRSFVDKIIFNRTTSEVELFFYI